MKKRRLDKRMTLERVVKRIRDICDAVDEDDHEAAHGQEDALYADVLATIATGYGASPKMLADAALATKKIEFRRWMA